MQLARIRMVQAELARNQLRILKLVNDATPDFSPAVVMAQFVAVTVLLLCVGAAIGKHL